MQDQVQVIRYKRLWMGRQSTEDRYTHSTTWNIENYYQEAGRAGNDEKAFGPLHSPSDRIKQRTNL
jgi:hypothetical protein